MGKILTAKIIVAGSAEGKALVSKQALSFWGGVSPKSGEIIDRRHELSGQCVSGKIFVFPHGKGSSTASAVLLETVRTGIGPAAIINIKLDAILALGSIIAEYLYERCVPIVLLPEGAFFQSNKMTQSGLNRMEVLSSIRRNYSSRFWPRAFSLACS